MSKLDLTLQRKKIIAEALEDYRRVGLSTEPADFVRAEQAITSLYASIGKTPPYFVRLSSPLAAELYLNLLCQTSPNQYSGDQLEGQLGHHLRDQLAGQFRDQLRGQLRDPLIGPLIGQLIGQLKNQLGDQLGSELRDQLREQLKGQLAAQLRGQLRGELRDQLWDQLIGQLAGKLRHQLEGQLIGQLIGRKLKYMGTNFWGNWDYYWMYMDGARQVGMRLSDKLNQQLSDHITITRSISWWYPFDDFCILVDRPAAIRLDNSGRLHSEQAKALEFRDGTGVSALDGIRVPDAWVEDKLPPAAQILGLKNADQRAVACKYAGWHTLLDQLGARAIDVADNPLHGSLFAFSFEGREQRCLVFVCPSDPSGNRIMSALVDETLNTAIEANAWMSRDTPEDLLKLEGRA